jgi:CRP/FNR family transcriptional regulator
MAVVEAVVFRRLDERLAARLLARDGTRIEVTHQALADELGSVREIVTRILRSFEGRGWVSLGRGQIVIRDRKGLLSLINQGEEGEDS